MSRQQPQRRETAIAVGSADEMGRIVIKSGQRFVKRHPAISLAWVAGLLVSILASGYTPSQQAVQNYEVYYEQRAEVDESNQTDTNSSTTC